MARRTNKSIAEILTRIGTSSSNTYDNDLLFGIKKEGVRKVT